MQIGIVGNGVVGNATAKSFEGFVDDVLIYDKLPERSPNTLNKVLRCDLVFVCLPTPQKVGSLACDTLAIDGFFSLHQAGSYKMRDVNLVLRSTVPIGYTRQASKDYDLPNLVHSPEFLTARTAVEDAKNPTRLLIGMPLSEKIVDWRDLQAKIGRETSQTWDGGTSTCWQILLELYKSRWELPVFLMSSDESEAVKLFQNAFSAMKVSIFNEFKRLADYHDLDWQRCLDALLAGGWINPMHTQVPGPDGKYGFGGSCLPKDLASLVYQMTEADLSCYMGYAALRRNEEDRNR